jgi:hypothetical protein
VSGLVIVTSFNFRPSHYSIEIEQKLKKIGELYWAIQRAHDIESGPQRAIAVQRLQQQRQEMIKSLPLYAVK